VLAVDVAALRERHCAAAFMPGFHLSVAVLPLPFRRSAVVKFRCSRSVKITSGNSVPLQP